MRMQLLDEDSIRIVLSSEEMQKLEIDWEEFDYCNTKSRKILWELFDRAKDETGFDASADRLLIKLFPRRNGGCELLVSKLCSDNSHGEEKRAYLFENVDDLLMFFEKLDGEHRKAWEQCKPLGNGRYCLVMDHPSSYAKNLLAEFSVPLQGKYIQYHLAQGERE